MKLTVLGSSSKGNCYVLEASDGILIIELGVPFKEVLQTIDFDLSRVVGCLVSHRHKDHCKYFEEAIKRGLDIYSYNEFDYKKVAKFGGYTIRGFECQHDVPCIGFYITHKEMGNMVFATDTYYVEYKFPDLNHVLVECNYSHEILAQNVEAGNIHPVLANRLVESHFELGNVKNFLSANNLTEVRNIVLMHLSSANSDADAFQYEIERLTCKQTYIARNGLEIDLNLVPF